MKEQAKVPNHENPTLLVETIGSKIYALDREMKYLINKVKSFRPKPKVDPKNTTTKEDKKDDQKSKSDTEEEKTDDEDGTVEEEDEADTVIPESQGKNASFKFFFIPNNMINFQSGAVISHTVLGSEESCELHELVWLTANIFTLKCLVLKYSYHVI